MATRVAVARYLPNGDLDNSFGDNGVSVLSFNDGFRSRTMEVRVGRNDSVLVCCEVANQLGLVRLQASGALDNGFGTDGRVVVPFFAGFDSLVVRSVFFAQGQPVIAPAVTPISLVGSGPVTLPTSPRVIVVGRVGGSEDQQIAAVAQYDPDGQLDGTFSGDGKTLIGFQSNRIAVVAAAFSARQGRISVVAEDLTGLLPTVHVGCLSLNGAPDESFGNGGRLSAVFAAPEREDGASTVRVGDAVIQPGTITLAGSATISDAAPPSFAVARVSDQGRDTMFGDKGLAFAHFETTGSFANSVLVDGRGQVVAAGFAGNGFALARFLRTGLLDDEFGQGGRVTTNFDRGSATAHVVKLESPGSERLVAAGGSGLRYFALARYLNDGSLDPSFGNGGRVSTDVAGEGSMSEVRHIAFDSQDRIVAVGPVSQQVA
jgi:uncharacterized delta-60 repeat protein